MSLTCERCQEKWFLCMASLVIHVNLNLRHSCNPFFEINFLVTAFNEILHWTPLFYLVELENVIFQLIDFKHSHCGTWKVCENSKYEMFFCFKLPEFLLGSFSCKTIYFLNVSAYCKSPPAVVFSQSQSILSSLWSVSTDRVYSETWINHHSLGK